MANIPISYCLKNIKERWLVSVVTIVCIAGVVGIFAALLSMAKGFQETIKSTGSKSNIMIRRAGATSEIDSILPLEQKKIVEALSGIAQDQNGNPILSSEVVVVATLPSKHDNSQSNIIVRGVSERVLMVRPKIKIKQGRFIKPGLPELVVGKNTVDHYKDLHLNSSIEIGGQDWKIVGILDGNGSAFDSEIWCDVNLLNEVYRRPKNLYQTIMVRLAPQKSITDLKSALEADPRLTLIAESEFSYYQRQSNQTTVMIKSFGYIVAGIMGIGAVLAALNTMFISVSARAVEVGTLRAIGFSQSSIMTSFMVESLIIALIGGLLGCIAVLPLNDFSASAINWSTYSHLAFAFKITPNILLKSMLLCVIMGCAGGFLPALHAAKKPIALTLRGE